MPSSTPRQAKLMAAIAHGWHKPGGGGPSVKVAREFNQADKKTGILKRAFGGPSPASQMKAPFFIKNEARQMAHTGPINSVVGGRTDHLGISVPAGSHIIPADVVSGMGQGNTANGHAQLNHMFSGAPYGASMPRMGRGKGLPPPPKMPKFAKGGTPPEQTGEPVPIKAAGGEHVLTPAQVRMASLMVGGNGDPEHGHAVLDAFIKYRRKKTIKEMKNLPGPSK